MLVAPYLTAEHAQHCRERLDLQFIDTAGNAYLRTPGLYVFVQGEPPHRPTAQTMTGARGRGTATTLRATFVLLCRPDRLNAPYREIAEAAGIGLGTVGGAFLDLERRGYLTTDPQTRNRHLLEPTRLLDEWVTTFPIPLRPKLDPRRFRAPDLGWWETARLPEGARWGGEVAAAKLTDYLKPAAATIYLEPARARDTLDRLVQAHRLRADPRGTVEILEAFWKLPGADTAPDLVPPLLVYADLMATLDPRNLEVAVDPVARALGIDYLVTGATARDILLVGVYGLETGRGTRDVDLAIAVGGWPQFETVKTRLVETGAFQADEGVSLSPPRKRTPGRGAREAGRTRQ